MTIVTAMKCIYDTTAQTWAMEVALDGASEPRRFSIQGDDVENLIEAFDDAASVEFDPQTGHLAFDFHHDFEEEAEDDDSTEETNDEAGEDEEEEQERKPKKAR